MRFSNKVRAIIFILVLATSTYIGFLLGNTFCAVDNKQNCNFELTIYIEEDEYVLDALKSGQLTFFNTIDTITRDVKEDISKFDLDKEKFINLLTKVEVDVHNQELQA